MTHYLHALAEHVNENCEAEVTVTNCDNSLVTLTIKSGKCYIENSELTPEEAATRLWWYWYGVMDSPKPRRLSYRMYIFVLFVSAVFIGVVGGMVGVPPLLSALTSGLFSLPYAVIYYYQTTVTQSR